MRLNVTFGLLGVISPLFALGALVLGVLSVRVAFSGEERLDTPSLTWGLFALWNFFISFATGWAAVESWRALSHRIRGSRDQT
jgi:hypothetical protein